MYSDINFVLKWHFIALTDKSKGHLYEQVASAGHMVPQFMILKHGWMIVDEINCVR